jgi:glycogen operon protein
MLATLLLSQGVPMLLAGDECRRTQGGNNNAWCQDNAVSWFDWSLVEAHADLVRFVRELVRFRLDNPALRRRAFLAGGTSASGTIADVEWFSPDGTHVDWYAGDASVCCVFGAPSPESLLAEGVDGVPAHVMLLAHAGTAPRAFRLPSAPAIRRLAWRVFVDTSVPPPLEIHPDGSGPLVNVDAPLELSERSLVCLVAPSSPPEPISGRPIAPPAG